MPIDWEVEQRKADEADRAALEERSRREQERRERYLADESRIQRDKPKAIEIALRLLRPGDVPEAQQQEIKGAAEAADLETLEMLRNTILRQLEKARRTAVIEAAVYQHGKR